MSGPASRPRRVQLVVVGAGPGGLSTALAAHALGIGVVVLDRDPADRARAGSRALYLHRDSLRLLDRASKGLGGQLAARGLVWARRTTTFRGRTVFSRTAPATPPGELPPFTSLRQVDTEAVLRDAVRAAGIEVVGGAEVTGLHHEDGAVTATAADGRHWVAHYLVGADGARSAVRAAVGIDLRGARSRDHHVVVDVAAPEGGPMTGPGRDERVFHYRHPALGGRHVLVVPFAGGCQVDLQCRPDDDPDALSGHDEVAGWLPAVLDDGAPDRVLWRARYPFLQVVATAMADRSRRVLLVGEAGHLFPPFGARGMNSAIADGDAAACAVACALGARTAERAAAAVGDYSRLRGAAAERNCAAAGAALRHMRASGPRRAAQAGAAALAPLAPPLGAWLENAPYGPRPGGRVTPAGLSRY